MRLCGGVVLCVCVVFVSVSVWYLLVENRGVRQDFIQAEGFFIAYSVQRRCVCVCVCMLGERERSGKRKEFLS